MYQPSLAEYLHYRIKTHNRSVRQFAMDIGMQESTIHNYINARTEPKLGTLAIFAEYWAEKSGIPPHVLLHEMTFSETTTRQVLNSWRKKQEKKRRKENE